jgi:hypothetical protein
MQVIYAWGYRPDRTQGFCVKIRNRVLDHRTWTPNESVWLVPGTFEED